MSETTGHSVPGTTEDLVVCSLVADPAYGSQLAGTPSSPQRPHLHVVIPAPSDTHNHGSPCANWTLCGSFLRCSIDPECQRETPGHGHPALCSPYPRNRGGYPGCATIEESPIFESSFAIIHVPRRAPESDIGALLGTSPMAAGVPSVVVVECGTQADVEREKPSGEAGTSVAVAGRGMQRSPRSSAPSPITLAVHAGVWEPESESGSEEGM